MIQKKWNSVLLLAVLSLVGCTPKPTDKKVLNTSENLVTHASGFNLYPIEQGCFLEVCRITQAGGDTLRYVLSASEKEVITSKYPNSIYIQTPVKKVVTSSATQIAYLDAIGECKSILAAKTANYIFNKQVKHQLETGQTTALSGSIDSDKEQLVNLNPNLIIAVGYDSQVVNAYRALSDYGIGCIVISDWLETSLLGRLEWLKVFGALYHKTDEANTFYQNVVNRYDSLRALTKDIPLEEQPNVFTAVPYKGVWYMPGGDSYLGKLYRDAGLNYVYRTDSSSGSLHLSLEKVLADCRSIDNWLLNDNVFSKQELLAIDSRLADFNAFKQNKIYNFNAQIDADKMGNAYWELGITHPDWILSDLLYLFHPNLIANRQAYTPHFFHRFE